MALQFNPFLKGATGILVGLKNNSAVFDTTTQTFRVYPSTVPFPSSSIESFASLPAGYILSYSGLAFATSGSSMIISSGATSATTTAAGTLSWFAIGHQLSDTAHIFISDSIGLSGSGQILTVTSLTPGSGVAVSINFALSII